MSQLVEMCPSYLVHYDASLVGIGVRIFNVDAYGQIRECIRVIGVPLEFQFSINQDSAFQNAAEFLCPAVALCYLVEMG